MKKILLIIFDGIGDRPIKQFGGKTPLEAAATPNLDRLATEGVCGIMNSIPTMYYPTSEESHLAILGYDFVADYPGRGVFDGFGLGVKIKPGDMVFRVDFGTVDEELKLIDPRAGVIEDVSKLCKAISGIKIDNVTFNIYPSLLYRAVLVISGEPVENYLHQVKSAAISDTDPRYPRHTGITGLGTRVHHPVAKGREGRLVARALERYQYLTHQILNEHKINKKRRKKGQLPANFVLTRGDGYLRGIKPFSQKFDLKAACVAGAPMYKGVAQYLGMDVKKVRGASGTVSTNAKNKVQEAKKLLKKYDFVFLHFKGTDMAAEEFGDPIMKRDFLSRVDKEFASLLTLEKTVIAVTGDHSTPCELKTHSTDPVPILVWGGKKKDEVSTFSETGCKKGSLGHLLGKDVMKILTGARK